MTSSGWGGALPFWGLVNSTQVRMRGSEERQFASARAREAGDWAIGVAYCRSLMRCVR